MLSTSKRYRRKSQGRKRATSTSKSALSTKNSRHIKRGRNKLSWLVITVSATVKIRILIASYPTTIALTETFP